MSSQLLPLDGVTVVEFCQYLSGPSAGLRLADLGARVIKIESPGGDACRKLAIENLWYDERDSLLFHTINRNKESYVANLKDEIDLDKIRKLIAKADVMIHNFRPGVMTKLGLDFSDIIELNPSIVFAEITGYGAEGPWMKKPGQDLLLQAKSGLMYTSGNDTDPPVPFGLAIGDILCGAQVVQGIIAGLINKEKTGNGVKLEFSLLESLIDFQFELYTTYFSSGKLPERSKTNNGHSLLGAPYGLHKTKNGYLAVAMVPLKALGEAIDCEPLKHMDQEDAFEKRDEIKSILADQFIHQPTEHWIEKLRDKDLWAMKVHNWQELFSEEGFKSLEMELDLGGGMRTTRCPIRLNGQKMVSNKKAPELGADTGSIMKEFQLA